MHSELRMADEGVFFAPTANKARKSTGLRSMRLLLARLSVVSVLLGSDLPARSQVDVSNDLSRQSCTMTWSACCRLAAFQRKPRPMPIKPHSQVATFSVSQNCPA